MRQSGSQAIRQATGGTGLHGLGSGPYHRRQPAQGWVPGQRAQHRLGLGQPVRNAVEFINGQVQKAVARKERQPGQIRDTRKQGVAPTQGLGQTGCGLLCPSRRRGLHHDDQFAAEMREGVTQCLPLLLEGQGRVQQGRGVGGHAQPGDGGPGGQQRQQQGHGHHAPAGLAHARNPGGQKACHHASMPRSRNQATASAMASAAGRV